MRGTRPMSVEFLPPHRTGFADMLHPALGVPFFGLLHEFCHLVCLGKRIKQYSTRIAVTETFRKSAKIC